MIDPNAPDTCPTCEGTGFGSGWRQMNCPQCGGAGHIEPQPVNVPTYGRTAVEVAAECHSRAIVTGGRQGGKTNALRAIAKAARDAGIDVRWTGDDVTAQ